MAALFGLALTAGHKIRNKALVTSIVKNLAVQAGRQRSKSTGLAVTTSHDVSIVKHVECAEVFTQRADVTRLLEEKVNLTSSRAALTSIIGHCQTVLPSNYKDTDIHPLVCNKIIGAHSGYVHNADKLFGAHNLVRTGTYPGEIVPRLVNYMYHQYNGMREQPLRKSIAIACNTSEGDSSNVLICKDHPYLLWLTTSLSVIFVRYYTEHGLLLFATSKNALDKAVRGWSLDQPDEMNLTSGNAMGINLSEKTILRKSFADLGQIMSRSV